MISKSPQILRCKPSIKRDVFRAHTVFNVKFMHFCWPMKLAVAHHSSVVVKPFLAVVALSFTVPNAVGSFPLSAKFFHLLNGCRNPTGQEPMAVLGKKQRK